MKEFITEISSDLDYEGMVVDILYSDNLLAKLSCDEGLKNAQILIFDKEKEEPIWKLNYFSFVKILKDSLNKMKEANSLD